MLAIWHFHSSDHTFGFNKTSPFFRNIARNFHSNCMSLPRGLYSAVTVSLHNRLSYFLIVKAYVILTYRIHTGVCLVLCIHRSRALSNIFRNFCFLHSRAVISLSVSAPSDLKSWLAYMYMPRVKVTAPVYRQHAISRPTSSACMHCTDCRPDKYLPTAGV